MTLCRTKDKLFQDGDGKHMNEKLFRKNSLDKVTGPEQLDEYIKVAKPGLWVTLTAIGVLLLAVFIWGFYGTLPTTISAVGVVNAGEVKLYLPMEQADKVHAGMPIKAGDALGTVISVAKTPLSKAEIKAELQRDYFAETLNLADWNVPIAASIPGLSDGVMPLVITLHSVKPLDFFLN